MKFNKISREPLKISKTKAYTEKFHKTYLEWSSVEQISTLFQDVDRRASLLIKKQPMNSIWANHYS